jgi:hypothetical protein
VDGAEPVEVAAEVGRAACCRPAPAEEEVDADADADAGTGADAGVDADAEAGADADADAAEADRCLPWPRADRGGFAVPIRALMRGRSRSGRVMVYEERRRTASGSSRASGRERGSD